MNESTCIYCGAVVEDCVPAIDDDPEWARLAKQHFADCDWILTRGYRLCHDPSCGCHPH